MRLFVTPGEPAGVGPDLLLIAAQRPQAAALVAVADPDLMTQRASELGLPIGIDTVRVDALPEHHTPGRLPVLPVRLAEHCEAGTLNPANAGYVLDSLSMAVDCCLQGGALVTGPTHKANINAGGHAFTGHTEFLAERAGGTPVMLLSTPGLRVALATTHVPLRLVADRLNRRDLTRHLRILDADLRKRFKISEPRILVTGLNPHAGEDGHLGREEIDIIHPVVEQLRAEGLNLTGPVPGDTAFTPERLQHFDAVMTMFHDQGLPVLKAMGFGNAVNITLGLPIIRTSVDHGTALQLAGTGRANPGSMQAAIDMACELLGG